MRHLTRQITEKEIETLILQWLHMNKIYCWKNESTGLYDPTRKVFRRKRNPFNINGTADVLGILPDGKFLAIEVKRPKGKATEKQLHFLEQIKKNNGIAFLAYSVYDVEENLKEYLNNGSRRDKS